jgi:hypothetical protein
LLIAAPKKCRCKRKPHGEYNGKTVEEFVASENWDFAKSRDPVGAVPGRLSVDNASDARLLVNSRVLMACVITWFLAVEF